MMSVADITMQLNAVRKAPIPYVLAVGLCAVVVWWVTSKMDATTVANEAAALKLCDEHVSELKDRLAQSNRDLDEFKNAAVTKIRAEASQLPPSFVSSFEGQLMNGVAQIQKSNNNALATFGKSSGVISLPVAPNALQPSVPGVNSPTPKSTTPQPPIR